MLCAACGETSLGEPCGHCGQDPLLKGRYRLDRVLGRGSTGVTYAGTRLVDGATFALKEIRPAAGAKTEALARREIETLSRLSHPQLPAYIDSFSDGLGKGQTRWLVQALVDGRTLHDELLGRAFTESEVVAVVEGLLPVLAYLHGQDPPVIHRDVKPRNVVRGVDGKLWLLDLGSARAAAVSADFGGSTVAGTFGYMAPEQFRGDATPATDVYGLGALALHLLARREPAQLADASGRLQWQRAVSPSSSLRRVLGGMLEPDPALRLRDTAAVRAALGEPAAAPGEQLAAVESSEAAERRAWWLVAAAFLGVIVLVFLVAVYR